MSLGLLIHLSSASQVCSLYDIIVGADGGMAMPSSVNPTLKAIQLKKKKIMQ